MGECLKKGGGGWNPLMNYGSSIWVMDGALHLLSEIFLESAMSAIDILRLEVKHYLHVTLFIPQKPATLSFLAIHPLYFSNLSLNFAFISNMKQDSFLLMNFLYRRR